MNYSISLMLLCYVFTSCKVIKPDAPDLPPSQINIKPLPDSKIDLAVSINLAKQFSDFEASLQTDFGEEKQVSGSAKYSWFVHRNPLNLQLNADGTLDAADAAHCGGEVKIKNPINGNWIHLCGCDANANIVFNARFSLKQDYGLDAFVSKKSFTLTPCNLCQININVTPIALGVVNPKIDQGLASLNQKLATYNFKSNFEPAWNNLFNTIPIPEIGFLSINPSAVALGSPNGSGSLLHFAAGIVAKPVISLTDSGTPVTVPIPDLSPAVGSGFNVVVDGYLQYPELNTILKAQINNQKIPVEKKGYIQIKDIDFFGIGNDHLLIKIVFKAKYGWLCYNGNLYFTCLPKYDPPTKTLFVTEVNFDPKTQQKLIDKNAAWILNTLIKTFLGGQIKVPVSRQIDNIKAKLTAGINRQIGTNITLAGTVTDLNLLGMLPLAKYLLIRATTTGTLAVSIN